MLHTAPSLASTAAYCRQARRLRARFRSDVPLLHQALSHLSRQHDGEPCRSEKSTDRVSRARPLNTSHLPDFDANRIQLDSTVTVVERAFAGVVRDRSRGRLLRYSERLSLLKSAERLHIGRFRANLIIALVQHEAAGQTLIDPMDGDAAGSAFLPPILRMVGAVLMTEVIVGGVLWWACG